MEIPQVKISQGVIVGLAVGAAILAIVLFYENQRMRKDLLQYVDNKPRKPCGCQETAAANTQFTATVVPAGTHQSVITGRLDSAPMPAQTFDDPDHPPEVVI